MGKARLVLGALVALLLAAAIAGAAPPPPPLFYAVISDTQKGDNDPFDDFRWAVGQVNRLRPQFVLFPGDLTDSGSINQYEHWSAVSKDLQVPLFACPGNHEGGGCTPAEFRRRFREYTGLPCYYGRSLGGWHLFALDGVHFTDGQVAHEGALDPEQLTWLRQELARLPADKPILVMCHFPLLPEWKALENGAELLACFEDRYLAYTVTGHWHRNAYAVDARGRLHLATGSLSFALDANGIGYRLVSTIGYDLYTAWVRRDTAEPLRREAEVRGPGTLTRSWRARLRQKGASPPGRAVRVEYSGGPLRVSLARPGGRLWVRILPLARERSVALVPLREKWSALIAGQGELQVEVTPLGKTSLERVILESTGLSWQHFRLPGEEARPSRRRQSGPL